MENYLKFRYILSMGQKPQSLDDIFEIIENTETLDELWDALVSFLKSHKADLISYHHIPPHFAHDYKSLEIRAVGFPEEWVKSYEKEHLEDIDPITSHAQFALKPFRWSSMNKISGLTKDQRKYLDRLSSEVGGDGFAMPAFGPSGRNGYFGIGRKDGQVDASGRTRRRIYWACQAFHDQYSLIKVQGQVMDFELSEREMDVLSLMGHYHSETMIATLLHTKPERVEYHLSQVMNKMGVTDKGAAILRAYSCGLIDTPASLLPEALRPE